MVAGFPAASFAFLDNLHQFDLESEVFASQRMVSVEDHDFLRDREHLETDALAFGAVGAEDDAFFELYVVGELAARELPYQVLATRTVGLVGGDLHLH